jgi:hypothetical protein
MYICIIYINRVIHNSLREFRPLWYSSRDGHAEGEHVNRGRGSPIICPRLQVRDISTLGDISSTWQTFLAHAGQSRPIAPADLFVSQRTGNHSAGISCTTHEFQDTEHFLIHYERHFSSRLPPSGGTCKYAKAPSTKKAWRNSLPIDMLLSAVFALVVAQSSSVILEGLTNNPVF